MSCLVYIIPGFFFKGGGEPRFKGEWNPGTIFGAEHIGNPRLYLWCLVRFTVPNIWLNSFVYFIPLHWVSISSSLTHFTAGVCKHGLYVISSATVWHIVMYINWNSDSCWTDLSTSLWNRHNSTWPVTDICLTVVCQKGLLSMSEIALISEEVGVMLARKCSLGLPNHLSLNLSPLTPPLQTVPLILHSFPHT